MTLSDIAELPNGDLFFTGQIWIEDPDNPAQRTTAIWLVKTDSMGCLEPYCGSFEMLTADNTLKPLDDRPRLLVFPNPVIDQLQLHWPGTLDGKQYDWQLTDAFGRVLLQEQFRSGELENTSLAYLQAGIYFWQLYADGVLVDTGKVVKE